MIKFIFLVSIVMITLPSNIMFAKEPKTAEDFVDLLIEQQTKFFSRYTCEFEINESEVPNGRDVLSKQPFPNKVKFKAAKNNDEYAYHKLNEPQKVNWDFPDYFVRSDQSSLKFNPKLGIAGLSTISGFKGSEKKVEKFPSPENYFGAFTRGLNGDPKNFKRWLSEKKMIGIVDKISLDWPSKKESIHLRLESDYDRHDIYLDPDQGYLPIKMATYLKVGHDKYGSFDATNPTLATITVLLEAREISKKKYFPTKVVVLSPKDRSPDEKGSCQFLLFNVTKLDYDKEPTPEELSTPIPEGCLVGTDLGQEGPYIKFRKSENVKPSDLPKIISMLEKERESQAKTGQHAIQDTALPETPPRHWSRYLWWVVGGLAVITLFLFIMRRRSQRA